MGYHARVTQASADGGIDVIAHRDGLGFEPPIIKVQCKQTLSTNGRPDVQKLYGAIEKEEKGLFVTLGSFSSDARTFEQSKSNLRLLDGKELVELIFIHYDRFAPRYRALIPLKRTYSPGL
jgi:restriction system protein